MRRRLTGLKVVRLAFAVSVLEIGYALVLFYDPRQGPTGWFTAWLSTLFLIGGVTILTFIRYGIRGWLRVVLVGVPAIPLIAFAYFSSGRDGAMIRLVFLTLALALCGLLGRSDEPRTDGPSADLFELVYGFLTLPVGILMLFQSDFIPRSIFAPIGGLLPLVGVLALAGGVGLMAGERLGRRHRWLPPAARYLSVAVTALMAIVLVRNNEPLGGLMTVSFCLALLFRSTRTIGWRAPEVAFSGADGLLRIERSAESWTWILVIVVVAMTFLEDTSQTRHMIPMVYGVMVLVLYTVAAYWILPSSGQRIHRLLIHLVLLVATMAHLMAGGNAAAQGIALMAVVPPILATRAKGSAWGYAILVLTVVLLAGESLLRGLLESPGSLSLSGLVVRVFGLLTAGGLVIRSASEQRRLAESLQSAQQALQGVNEELTAQNEELLEAGRALTVLAERDPLTGLVNRRRFQEIVDATVHGRGLGALLFLDLDHFKEINDQLGHAGGDRVLQAVAQALSSQAGPGDIVARLGGDEFAVLSPGSDAAAAGRLAERILQRVRRLEEGGSFPVRASIGITLYPEQAGTMQALLVQADMAMYQVKRSGRNGVRYYAAEHEPGGGLYWENEVRRAMAEDRLFLVFQPIMALKTGEIVRYEALLRMVTPGGAVITPGDFLPHVEGLPLMDRVDRWVVQSAIREMAKPGPAAAGLRAAINLSARAFDDPQLPGIILQWLAEYQVPPERVIFEITETSAISDLDRARMFIDTLRLSGCRFAIDDLGSGFASFSYLRHLPVDYVKIDGQLVQDLREGTLALVQGIVAIARGLRMETIAEWVEDQETLDLLRRCQVDYVQGFLIGHPGPLLPKAPAEKKQDRRD